MLTPSRTFSFGSSLGSISNPKVGLIGGLMRKYTMQQCVRDFPVRRWISAVVLVACVVVVGCATIEDLAPPVDATVLQLAAAHEIDADRLSQGRALYITACARCHRPEAVVRYTREHWGRILPRMSARARFGPDEAEAVEAYVQMTLQAADMRPGGDP